MKYELWAKDRETMTYQFIKYIALENQFCELYNVDTTLFVEAMIITRTATGIRCVNYREYDFKMIRKKG